MNFTFTKKVAKITFCFSPYFGFGTRYTGKMGSIMRNGSHVIGAKALMHIWTTVVDKEKLVKQSLHTLNVDNVADNVNLEWELGVIKVHDHT